MSTAIQPASTASTAAPAVSQARLGRALILAETLAQEADQRKLLGDYVRHHMTEGTDYGVIPGTEKKDKDGRVTGGVKALLKPGAEKLTQLFRCVPRYTVEEKIEQWETALFYYLFKCQIVSQADGSVVAEGVGSCSTYESRYRWRKQDRKCPHCGKEAIKRSKFPPKNAPEEEPGWYCYSAIGGCGANFDHDDPDITDQPTGRTQNPDLLDQVNTVLKMAKKRALVDASIALARCSDIFTQDMDDDTGESPARPTEARTEPKKPDVKQAASAWTKDSFGALLARKGVTWGDALRDIDHVQRTSYVSSKSAFDKVAKQHIADYAAWLNQQPDAPAEDAVVEGEQGSDPTAPVASAPSAAPATASVATAPATAATDAAPKAMPGAERRTAPPKDWAAMTAGERSQVLSGLMVACGVAWPEIRDQKEGKGAEIATALKLNCSIGQRVVDLPAADMARLRTHLEAIVAEKKARAAKREANAARREMDAQEERQEAGAA